MQEQLDFILHISHTFFCHNKTFKKELVFHRQMLIDIFSCVAFSAMQCLLLVCTLNQVNKIIKHWINSTSFTCAFKLIISGVNSLRFSINMFSVLP